MFLYRFSYYKIFNFGFTSLLCKKKPGMPTKLLLVLDLNGTLLNRINKSELKLIDPSVVLPTNTFSSGINKVFLRPHLETFLNYIFNAEHITVCVWTSAELTAATDLCHKVFGIYSPKLAFVLNRSMCVGAPMGIKAGKTVRKPLDRIWSSNQYNPKNIWNRINTILIDDSAYKGVDHPRNMYLLQPFDVTDLKVVPTADEDLLTITNWLKDQGTSSVDDIRESLDIRRNLNVHSK